MGQLFRPRGLILILNDVVVGFGLGLLVLGMTLTYLAAMLLVAVVFIDFSPSSALGGWAFLFAVLFLVPIAMLFSITVEVVRSSHKAVVVCFVQVREHTARSFTNYFLLFDSDYLVSPRRRYELLAKLVPFQYVKTASWYYYSYTRASDAVCRHPGVGTISWRCRCRFNT